MLAASTILAATMIQALTLTTIVQQQQEAYAQFVPPLFPSLPSTGIQIDNSANIDCDDKCDADVRQENTIIVDRRPDTIILPTPFQP